MKKLYELIMDKFFQCPYCNGKGGEVEPVTDEGYGPYYPCGFCNGTGYMNPFERIWTHLLISIAERRERKYETRKI